MKLPRYPSKAEWDEIVALGPGVRMHNDKMTLFYNGETLCEGTGFDRPLTYDEEKRQSWEVILVLPGVEVIPQSTFIHCRNIKTVIMADTVRRIESRAFICCASLEFIRLSIKLERIGVFAFIGCVSLPSIFIPPSCQVIAEQAFGMCERLFILSIPQSVNIGTRLLRNTAFLEALIRASPYELDEEDIIQSIKSINNEDTYALHRLCCSHDQDIEEVYRCVKVNGLPAMNLPNSIGITPSQYLAANPYSTIVECELVKRYVLEMMGEVLSSTAELDATENSILHLTSELESTLLNTAHQMKLPRYPSKAEWDKIVALGPGVRMHNDKMTLFYNGETLCEGAGFDCPLTYNLLERQKWEVILVLPGVEVIPQSTFIHCRNIKTVIMADTVRRIESDAFICCASLEFIRLSIKLERIGVSAFSRCVSLPSIFIPPSCQVIAERAFSMCERLFILSIPQSVNIGTRLLRNTAFLEALIRASPYELDEEDIIQSIKSINNEDTYALHRLCCSHDQDIEEVYRCVKVNGLPAMNLSNSIGITPSQYLAANPYSTIVECELVKRYVLEMMGEEFVKHG
ncbi:hypothetical protein CTEN210_11093 [Chaetoceros tenuissimus]|uniref:Uncharacterized protein n=1 Tax=Chaetoceros tenuissimus TaxID=426638 RepID=A0AAD3H8K6_9STRA|nr:hypothetical protein CTEN210_11093 [Chaetoceros tenuissimus]